MSSNSARIRLTIDQKTVEVPEGTSVLAAARQQEIEIPTLCAYKDLSPFGGCRMCIVEVEGTNRFLTACTTVVTQGMIVHTQTAALQEARREIFRLLLSEHPASCLVCGDQASCQDYMLTLRKVGVTTGCSNCPKNGRCELKSLALKLGMQGFDYPLHYRGIKVEKHDPFIDRDYNLCILCGRCVRACQELRLANVLTFKMRGLQTLVGPAFEDSYSESGCEFCGTCLDVCPTGALSERAAKWQGLPENTVQTTCMLCGLGCQLDLQIRQGRVIGALGVDADPVSRGLLCVKGRFALPELLNAPDRLKKPQVAANGQLMETGWDQALDLAVQRLSTCPPEKFGMLVSAGCTLEDLFVAQKFAREVMGSRKVDNGARNFYGEAWGPYLRLFARSAPLSSLDTADVILTVGLDTRYSRSVVGTALQRALKRGAHLVTVHPHAHNLSRSAELWLKPSPGEGDRLFRWLADEGELPALKEAGDAQQMLRAYHLLHRAHRPVILVGPEVSRAVNSASLLSVLSRLAVHLNASILPLPGAANLVGAAWLGIPGWNAAVSLQQERLQVLYCIGEWPSADVRENADFIFFQDLFAPKEPFASGLVLPAAAFTELEGTVLTGEGRLQSLTQAIEPLGEALPDWQILCRIARQLGKPGFDFASAADIRAEMAAFLPDWAAWLAGSAPHALTLDGAGETGAAGNGLDLNEDLYRAFPLVDRVAGLRRIA
jgi:formate dehydrogenase (NADP+) alpha subunit